MQKQSSKGVEEERTDKCATFEIYTSPFMSQHATVSAPDPSSGSERCAVRHDNVGAYEPAARYEYLITRGPPSGIDI